MGRWSYEAILEELRRHAPYTLLGTIGGAVVMLVLVASHTPRSVCETLFWTFHPLHVLLSALVTTGVLRRHRQAGWPTMLLVGYLGSIGIATLSDSAIPYVGECLLDLPHRAIHWGFIEKWWLVNPLALAGIALACWYPATKIPHAGHVWLSTWASLFHITMASDMQFTLTTALVVLVFLFLAVWVPCCTSDIVFPMLWGAVAPLANSTLAPRDGDQHTRPGHAGDASAPNTERAGEVHMQELSEAVRERACQPRHYGPISPCDGHARITGPCGDTMEFWIRMQQGHLVAIGFTTTGCGTSRAAGSMTAELAMGQTLETVQELDDRDVLDALGGLPAESRHCALLATNTLLAAIDDALAREVHGSAEL